MKYLFAAIDARQSREKEAGKGSAVNGRSARPKYNALQLKRLVIEASEAVDDKSAANDFQDTLERIVNEIKNTTEHSGPFLQKVRKADVPDYYDVIKRPMDLATLLKKVKQQSYRTKKAFAEDLDLIWSNCLLYNSHPNHPLRHSAEVLRAKSNQLLEFITDPVLSQRSLLAASLGGRDRRGSSIWAGTPDVEDGDADAESDDDAARSRRGMSERLLNGVNGEVRDSSASPGPSRSATPAFIERRLSRKLSRGPLGRISLSPEPLAAAEIPFEERPAIIRTAQSMNDFLSLDEELAKLERCDFKPVPSALVLPPSVFSSAPTSAAPVPAQSAVTSLIRNLNPTLLSKSSSVPIANVNGTETPAAQSPPSSTAPLPAAAPRDPSEPIEALWWDVVASTSTAPLLFPSSANTAPTTNGINGTNGHSEDAALPDETPIPSLAAGMPHIPWVGYTVTPFSTVSSSAKGKGKGRAIESGVAVGKPKTGKKGGAKAEAEESGLAIKMRRNIDTLRRIRKAGDRLLRESQTGDLAELPPVSSDESEVEEPVDAAMDVDGNSIAQQSTRPRPRKRARFAGPPVPKSAFRCPATAPLAAQQSLRGASGDVLSHAGFEGTSGMALDVLAHVAAEYLTNLGRTDILLHTLAENGVPAPSSLEAYVSEDIDRYGTRLSDLLAKLDRTRQERLDEISPEDQQKAEQADDEVFADDGEALVRGDIAAWTGDDFFGVAEIGLDRDLGISSLIVPKQILREESLASTDGL
ncbi:SPOSA6832_03880, partial [Sporobolomyces salmonicolor]